MVVSMEGGRGGRDRGMNGWMDGWIRSLRRQVHTYVM